VHSGRQSRTGKLSELAPSSPTSAICLPILKLHRISSSIRRICSDLLVSLSQILKMMKFKLTIYMIGLITHLQPWSNHWGTRLSRRKHSPLPHMFSLVSNSDLKVTPFADSYLVFCVNAIAIYSDKYRCRARSLLISCELPNRLVPR
jgi:hypothetical protein